MGRVLTVAAAVLTLTAASVAADDAHTLSPLFWAAYGQHEGAGIGAGLTRRLGNRTSSLRIVGAVAVHYKGVAESHFDPLSGTTGFFETTYSIRADIDIVVDWRWSRRLMAYAGPGLTMSRVYSQAWVVPSSHRRHYTSNPDPSPQLVAGLEIGQGRTRPFVQGALDYDFQNSDARVMAGLRF